MNASQSKKHTWILVTLAVFFLFASVMVYWLTEYKILSILFSSLFAGAVVEILRKLYQQQRTSD